MALNTSYTISAVPLDYPYELVTGYEAKQWLEAHGFTFVHVTDDGSFQALSKEREPMNGFYLYKSTQFVW